MGSSVSCRHDLADMTARQTAEANAERMADIMMRSGGAMPPPRPLQCSVHGEDPFGIGVSAAMTGSLPHTLQPRSDWSVSQTARIGLQTPQVGCPAVKYSPMCPACTLCHDIGATTWSNSWCLQTPRSDAATRHQVWRTTRKPASTPAQPPSWRKPSGSWQRSSGMRTTTYPDTRRPPKCRLVTRCME